MELSLHSTKKHRAIGYYLYLIKALISSKNSPFNILYYADLYCGDGECIIDSIGKEYKPPIISSLLKPAKEKGFPVICFLNDNDKDRIDKMKENTKDYLSHIDSYGNQDANIYYKKVLQKIPKDQFSIFFLDPTNHNHLKWDTIKGISQHQSVYFGNQVRRPELVINLMTFTMLGSYKSKSFQSINENLGTDEWLEEIEKNKEKRIKTPVETAFFETFKKQLRKLGYEVPTPIKIISTKNLNVIYYLVWATNKAGYNIIEKRLIPWINKLMEKAQKENVIELKKANVKKQGMVPLNKWIE